MAVRKKRSIRTSLLVLVCAAAFSGAAHAAEVHVLATGALSAAFKQLVPAFERDTGNHLLISWGPSYGTSPDALPMRIKNSEPMDVCFMISTALDEQIKQGVFVADTRTDIAETAVGVAVRRGIPKPDVSTPEKLKAALLSANSVAFSEGASGTYITGTLFPKLGIVEQMKQKSVLIKGRELVGAALQRGDADLGLQQISELKAFTDIQFVGPLPPDVQKVSVISGAISKSAQQSDAAKAFIAYLKSKNAVAIFDSTGLEQPQAH
ncbi:substrate-binding domain-containing protein [Paraburkholderia graminis]|jgi:molybdate transport system substrate-binding protein|uniref:substrate-binding domain-containing protein n=1 Tax=Paraburkholderia graminis TaxID=60548 RepID=UPI00278F7400|nr:substrate-binding domain-containing protein [Paraburkholderia graminis]MDQ0621025.1 molybdate transport system substrate-binding protein [Paraburkholderia graminis]